MDSLPQRAVWELEAFSRSEEETIAWGERLAETVRPGDLIIISGELGTGKTRLVQGIARGLGVEERVTSPTFALVREYQGRLPLYHVDLYRLEAGDLPGLGLEEYAASDGVTCIEWGEKALAEPGVTGKEMLLVEMSWLDESLRSLRIRALGEKWESRALEGAW